MSIQVLLLTLLLSFAAGPADTEKPATIPDGLVFNCSVHGELSSDRSKVGDPVDLEVASNVNDGTGKLLLPARTRLTGTVTMVRKRTKDEKPALAIRLTEAHWKSGSATLNGVFGGDVMVKEHIEGMTGTHMTTHRGGDTATSEGIEQVEGYADEDPTLGTILHAKHDIRLTSKNVVSIRTIP